MAEVFNWIRKGYELVTVKFEWNVLVPYLQTADYEIFKSPLFSPQETPNSKWKLGFVVKIEDVGIHVKHYNSTEEYVKLLEPIMVKMVILDQKGQKVFHQMAPSSPDASSTVFRVSKESLKNQECQLSEESFTFCCKIFTHVEIVSLSPADPSVNVIDCSGGLSNHLKELFDNMQFSDVNFNIGGREFPAHKSILTARSEVFAAMFQHPTKENLTNQIKIDDIEPDVFQELLHFIYTGRVQVDKLEMLVAGLFIAADKYLLDELKLKCENYLLRNMSPENCVFLLLHGDLRNPTKPLKEAAKFFRLLPSQVMATDGWKKIEEENLRLLCQIQKFLLIAK